ncbi:hypothetical protein Tco_0289856, partial [Tanacetum coccineum]
MLEKRIKILEARLKLKRHPEDHTCQSGAILYELLDDMENLCLVWKLEGGLNSLQCDHPSHVRVYVRILSRGKEIVKVIVQNISPNLRDALEGLSKVDRNDSNIFSAFLRQYVLIVETVSTYDLCMKVMHMIMRRMPWDLGDFSMDIWHGFMKELHEFLFDSDWDQLSHPPDIVCMECGSDMVPKLCAKGNRMNDEKFVTFEEMDGYASGPDEEDTHNSFSIYFLNSGFTVIKLTFLK